MEDFFENFWNWLVNKNQKKRIAPLAKDRYKNSKKLEDSYFRDDIKYQSGNNSGVKEDVPYLQRTPSIITRQAFDNDTIYRETPGHERFALIGMPVIREASYKNPKGDEYEILKRRLNTAWNLAR